MDIKRTESKQKMNGLCYTASICVHIPFSSLKDYRMDFKSTIKSIANKTKTYIESYELIHLQRIRFCIFGKWRDCLQAGRLLWYQLIRVTTIYVHFDWIEDLEKPMRDQKDKPFKQLYRSVKLMPLTEYNLFSISGICWDVLKVRKELLKRCTSKTINEQQMVGVKTEVMALQVLNSIRTDINDGLYSPESIYSIRNSQLLHLITGSKSPSAVDQIEAIRYPKEFIAHFDTKCHNLNNNLLQIKQSIVSKPKDNVRVDNSSKGTLVFCESNNSTQIKTKRYSMTRAKLTQTNSNVKEIKCKESTLDKHFANDTQTKCQMASKTRQTNYRQLKQIQKQPNIQRISNGLDTNTIQSVKIVEHKLIADRIQLLVDSQRNQTSNQSEAAIPTQNPNFGSKPKYRTDHHKKGDTH